jgi:hypothetical protein
MATEIPSIQVDLDHEIFMTEMRAAFRPLRDERSSS